METIKRSIRFISATAAEWATSNRVLAVNDVAIISDDPTRVKFGQAVNSYEVINNIGKKFSQLPYVNTTDSTSNAPATPFAVNVTAAISAANLLKKYFTSTSAAPVTATLPTGALLGAALSAVEGTELPIIFDNSAGANTVTVAVNTGIVLAPASMGLLTVPAGAIAKFNIIFKTATTAVINRVSLLEAADVAALVDNSTGASGAGTIAAVTNPNLASWDGATVFPSAAQATAINAAITSLKNAVATLAAQNNAMRIALVNAGVMA